MRPKIYKGELKMYVYDQANELARSLKESKEYLEYKKAKRRKNEQIKRIISNTNAKSKSKRIFRCRSKI